MKRANKKNKIIYTKNFFEVFTYKILNNNLNAKIIPKVTKPRNTFSDIDLGSNRSSEKTPEKTIQTTLWAENSALWKSIAQTENLILKTEIMRTKNRGPD